MSEKKNSAEWPKEFKVSCPYGHIEDSLSLTIFHTVTALGMLEACTEELYPSDGPMWEKFVQVEGKIERAFYDLFQELLDAGIRGMRNAYGTIGAKHEDGTKIIRGDY